MKIFTSSQVRKIDEFTIENEPIESIDLMERAAKAFANWFTRTIDSSKEIFVFCGPGNNGGDGFAVARLLKERHYKVKAVLVNFSDKISDDCKKNMEIFRQKYEPDFISLETAENMPDVSSNSLVIDAIFGSGLSRPVEGLAANIIRLINSSWAYIVSVDVPSGLFGEDNRENNPDTIIRANRTLTFQFPFLSFFFAENYTYTGNWVVADIGLHPEAIEKTESKYQLTTIPLICNYLHTREKFSHKGSYGHALIIAGCYGMMGAAILTTKACLRTGAGLVTAHIPRFGYDIVQTSIPEALISMDVSDIVFTEAPDLKDFNAVGVGPGLSCKANSGKGIFKLLSKTDKPLVVDADALNILSANPDWIELLPENTIITPHPKEFDRLAGESKSGYERHLKQLAFSAKNKLIVVLKGAYTFISFPDGKTWINTTGNPGMASGGSGDVLTGMIVSLLAQSYTPAEAAITAVFLHGLAADIAIENGQCMESLLAGDIIENIGAAFNKIRKMN